jgi:hypothetical protein
VGHVAALLRTRQVHHPLGCNRPRIPDQVVFDMDLWVPVFGCGYRRIADHTCSATTLRRRRDDRNSGQSGIRLSSWNDHRNDPGRQLVGNPPRVHLHCSVGLAGLEPATRRL